MGFGRSRKGRARSAAAALAALLLIFSFGPGGSDVVHGADKRTVRVSFFPMDGYHETLHDGSYSGMDVEYLENLCDYVNWSVEYVPCGSWDEALQMLADRKVDLVGSAQYSEERAQIYRYADLANGYTFGAVAVSGSSPLAYEDFEAMKDITYGIVSTYVRKQEFYEYLAGHGVANPKIIEYENTAALQSALSLGEIDALVHSLTEIREGQRVIGRFAPRPFYYITYPGNEELLRELNQGIGDVKMNRPELENELMVKYYDSRLDHTILLTSEEKDYIEKTKMLTVGCLDGYYPFSYRNEEGEYKGLVPQILEEVSKDTGLTFRYIWMEDMEEAKKELAAGTVDIIGYCGEGTGNIRQTGGILTKVYARVPHVIIMKRGSRSEELQTLAVASDNVFKEGEVSFAEGVELLKFADQRECLQAVRSGRASAALCDGYMAEYLLGSQLGFGRLEIHTVLSDVHEIRMVVEDDADSPLLGILNKELPNITDKTVNDYMLQDNFYSRMSVESFIRDHSIVIIIVLFVGAVLAIFVLYRMLDNSRRLQKLMYKDTDFNIWNLNYLKYRASLKLGADRDKKYAIVYTDICQFKSYNALYGWSAGQRLLELTIEELSSEIDSERELYARSYGSHFVLFVCFEEIEQLEKRMRDMANRISGYIYDKEGIRMTQALGICEIGEGETDVQLALSYAIQTVDPIKNSRSNVVRTYDEELRRKLREQQEREMLLDKADVRKDFVAYYQAKVDIRSERVVGAEALVRFKDPTDGGAIRAPSFFVPYYEQTGRIMEIDFFVMESVCQMLRKRIDQGLAVVPVSCNFSRSHFVREEFPAHIESVIEKYQIPKNLIEVEITETLVVEEMQQQKVKENVDILKKNGIHLSIDDFGSGYSSLGVFEQIPASVIKLDRSFLLNNKNRERQVQIMKNIVNLARDLDAQVVCEGVETAQDTELMMEIGAFVAQGYRYCKPVPEEVFEEMIE